MSVTIWVSNMIWIWILIFSRQGPQTGASHRRAVVCEQLAQGCYLRVQQGQHASLISQSQQKVDM